MPVFTAAAAYIATAIGVTSAFGIAAIGFGLRLVTSYVISSIIADRSGGGGGNQQANSVGNRVQLAPNTTNKIPVVYGSSFMKPIIVDAKISEDQQTMWHVMVFSEAMESDSIGTFSFGDIYWGDKKLVFDQTDQTKVTSWINSDGTTETQPDGLLNVYLYRDGSSRPINTTSTAIQILSDSTILEANRWDSTKLMTKLVFAIVKIKYNQEKGITGLTEITAKITNTLKSPGAVILDYLTNSRYGAGLDSTYVDTASLTALNNYSAETISYTPAGGGSAQTMNRYSINGPVDTTRNFLSNILDICDSCDSWLQWNEVEGQWGVIINRSYLDTDPTSANLMQIDDDQIVGGIDINPVDLNSTYNSVRVEYPNTRIKDQAGYHIITLDEFPNLMRSPNEPDNQLTLTLPYTNTVVQAQYIAARRLLQSREDLAINFTMDYSGIQLEAGDVIGIHHNWYGWGRYSETVAMPYGKLFRVAQVQEGKSDDGSLYARITASEYNDDVYDDNSIDLADFIPEPNTGISDPGILTNLNAPTITDIKPKDQIPNFTVRAAIPSTGNVQAVEYWYGTTESQSNSVYKLYGLDYPANTTFFPRSSTSTQLVTNLSTGTYYFRVRGVGVRRKTAFSSATSIAWAPEFVSSVSGLQFGVQFQPPSIGVPRFNSTSSNTVTTNLSVVNPKAYGTAGGAVVPFVLATSDSDPLFVNNSWRIGTSSSTGYLSTGALTTSSIGFTATTISTTTDLGVQLGNPTFITSSTAAVTIPVRYKDGGGNIVQAAPATENFYIVDPGINGNTLYRPRVYFNVPINGTSVTISGGTYNRETFSWSTRPTTRYGAPPYTYVDNYDYAVALTTGSYRYTAMADPVYTTTNFGSYAATWSTGVQIEAGFGPAGSDGVSPSFIDFDYSQGTTFVKSTSNQFTPQSITIRATATNVSFALFDWSITGAAIATTSTSVFPGDTVTVYPSTTSNRIVLSATAGGFNKSITLPIISLAADGTKGDQGDPGDPGPRGFTPLNYIPITVDPFTATNAELSAAWLTATGYNPVTNDGGSFYYGTTSKSFSYNSSGTWIAASFKIAGDLVADGTIRANALAANSVFTNKLASTGATFGDNNSGGYWLDGSSGNARFGGNVSIGGIITAGAFRVAVIDRENLKPGVLPNQVGPSSIPSGLNFGYNDWTGGYDNTSYKQAGYYKLICPQYALTANLWQLRVDINFNYTYFHSSIRPFFMWSWLNGKNEPNNLALTANSIQTPNFLFEDGSMSRVGINYSTRFTYSIIPSTQLSTTGDNYWVFAFGSNYNLPGFSGIIDSLNITFTQT